MIEQEPEEVAFLHYNTVPDLNFIILGITVAVFPHVCEIMSSN
jgi:hypothetical protein